MLLKELKEIGNVVAAVRRTAFQIISLQSVACLQICSKDHGLGKPSVSISGHSW